MYPDLSYFFYDLLGTNVDNWTAIFKTFGLFLALAFFASAYILRLEFIRKENEGILKPTIKTIELKKSSVISSTLINGLIGFFFGWKIPAIILAFDAFKNDPSSIVFSGAGNLLIGVLAGLAIGGYAYYAGMKQYTSRGEGKKQVNHFPHQMIGDITVVAAISGVLGSRLLSIVENSQPFFEDPIGQIFSGSGLSIYGGLIVGSAVCIYYIYKKGLPVIHVIDAAALAIIMGYIVGRMGCHFSGDGDWGIANAAASPGWFFLPDWLWSYEYPHNVINQGIAIEGCDWNYCNRLSPGVFPTPLYEIIMSGAIFGILWFLRKRIKVGGVIFFLFVALYGVERFFIEFIRVNDRYGPMDFSLAQYLSIAFVILGVGAIFYLYSRNKVKA